MKRKAEDAEGAGPPSPAKRQQLSLPLLPLMTSTTTMPVANPTCPPDETSPDNDLTTVISSAFSPPADNTAYAPSATATSVAATPSSRRSRKFPSDLKTIKCTWPGCPKTFNRPARLTAHLRSHTNDRPHKCPYPGCDKAYLEEKHLAQHIKGSHTHEKKYQCLEPGCGKAFVTATRLRRHAAVHEGAERFRCRGYDGCDLSFRKHQTLQRHIRVAHLGLPAFSCGVDGCEAGFDTAGALRRHVDREHGEIKFWCEECSARAGNDDDDDDDDDGQDNRRRVGFRTLSMLQAHMRREHVNCAFCDVRCNGQAELERHVDMYHSGTTVADRKTVVCEWEGCGKRFTRVSNLNTHVRTAHQGLRFVCGQVDTSAAADLADWNWAEEGCGQTFVSKLKLEEHVRYVHLGRKRPPTLYPVPSAPGPAEEDEMSAAVPTRTLPCPEDGCDAKFIRHHDLDKHMRKCHRPLRPKAEAEARPVEEDAIDPRLQAGSVVVVEEEELLAALPMMDEPGFEAEWAEMRRLIDLDLLMDGR
ncbi:hypothetical protein VTJ83DRAFT_1125 [Remersonia thermophila]|uniref:C2H2-type domain-containing protein n=1 Tax=Remersonia thermophila TaxID=72144 RepID=A0ABR4DQV0_9PEZI